MISPLQAQFQVWMAKAIGAKRSASNSHSWSHLKTFPLLSLATLPFISLCTTALIPTPLVLEIGTFIGFSTMSWAEAVGPSGHVTALEFSPEYVAIAEESFAKNGIKNVEVVVGDAKESYVPLLLISLGWGRVEDERGGGKG